MKRKTQNWQIYLDSMSEWVKKRKSVANAWQDKARQEKREICYVELSLDSFSLFLCLSLAILLFFNAVMSVEKIYVYIHVTLPFQLFLYYDNNVVHTNSHTHTHTHTRPHDRTVCRCVYVSDCLQTNHRYFTFIPNNNKTDNRCCWLQYGGVYI